MKQMKMKEKEATKLDGQLVMLEEQKMMIESTMFDGGVVSALKDTAGVMEQLNKANNIEDMEELYD